MKPTFAEPSTCKVYKERCGIMEDVPLDYKILHKGKVSDWTIIQAWGPWNILLKVRKTRQTQKLEMRIKIVMESEDYTPMIRITNFDTRELLYQGKVTWAISNGADARIIFYDDKKTGYEILMDFTKKIFYFLQFNEDAVPNWINLVEGKIEYGLD